MKRTEHWDRVYTSKGDLEVSWFEPEPSLSLAFLEAAGLTASSRVVDIGGGNSRLVDALIAKGVKAITVLDVSQAAIDRARERLGESASGVTWMAADAAEPLTLSPVDIWHDRAVFHFLTDPDDRARYISNMERTIVPGGAAVIATFALDGPEKCSGLPVARYSPETLAQALGPGFRLVDATPHRHRTPWGAEQAFQYSRFARIRS